MYAKNCRISSWIRIVTMNSSLIIVSQTFISFANESAIFLDVICDHFPAKCFPIHFKNSFFALIYSIFELKLRLSRKNGHKNGKLENSDSFLTLAAGIFKVWTNTSFFYLHADKNIATLQFDD